MPFAAGDLDRGLSADAADALAVTALALARRFADGATLWCVAPAWREHARHVAVEFVHPVIVGKPALAAVSVDDVDPIGSFRALVDVGDVVMTIGDANSRVIHEVVRRCPAWGAMSIWIGAGPRPGLLGVDHLLWVDDDPATAAHDGRLVFQYHVLWELTHVCLEHPGLLSTADGAANEATCTTCSDEGRLGEVMRIDEPTATVRTARGIELVDTSIVVDVQVDDLVLIHAGTAIAVLRSDDASLPSRPALWGATR